MFFVKIVVPPHPDAGNGAFADNAMMGRLMTLLHRSFDHQNTTSNHAVAVSFPLMSNMNLGKKIHLFAQDQVVLEQILQDKNLSRFLSAHCSVSLPRIVEDGNIDGFVRFSRDRKADKCSPSYIRRTIARIDELASKNRFAKAIKDCLDNGDSVGDIINKFKTSTRPPFFTHESLSMIRADSEQTFVRIYVKKEIVVDGSSCSNAWSFDSFGLSLGGVVPLLKQD